MFPSGRSCDETADTFKHFCSVGGSSRLRGEDAAPEPRVVDLTATDGVHLKATYFAADKPGPGVILLHQCNQQRKNWDDLAGRLATAGINVLTLDYRGYGDSEGPRALELSNEDRTRMITEQWPDDIDTAFQYLSSQAGVTKDVMGAAGASCGVNQSIQLARRHAEVKSLVLLPAIRTAMAGNSCRCRPGCRFFSPRPMMMRAQWI